MNLLGLLTGLGVAGAVLTADGNFITQAVAEFQAGHLLPGVQALSNALATTCGALHIHVKWNFFGVKGAS